MPPLRGALRPVVYPGACIARGCPFVYAYEAWGHTYMGCMQKVFDVEIDVDLLGELEGRREGFGAVKARRTPLPMCHSEISSCYEHRVDEVGCRNPEFFELPLERPSFRVFAHGRLTRRCPAAPESASDPRHGL